MGVTEAVPSHDVLVFDVAILLDVARQAVAAGVRATTPRVSARPG
jgi:hypothetical protein